MGHARASYHACKQSLPRGNEGTLGRKLTMRVRLEGREGEGAGRLGAMMLVVATGL